MPRLRTHQLASAALASVVFGLVFPHPLTTLIGAFIVAWIADWVIDRFGHRSAMTYDGYFDSSRTPLTHSVLTAPSIGFLVGLLIAYLLIAIKTCVTGLFSGDPFDAFVATVSGGGWFLSFLNFNVVLSSTGIMTGLLHLFLDSLTQNGIYLPFKRGSISNVSACDAGLNITLKLAAILTMTYVLGTTISLVGALLPLPLFLLPLLALGLLTGTLVTIVRHRNDSYSEPNFRSSSSSHHQMFTRGDENSFNVDYQNG